MEGRALDYVALGMLIFVCITIIYGVIFIHDIPYEIAKKRKHPHQDAIHTAGWVSLFLMHSIWPFLWIWATLYKPGYGWGIHYDSQTEGAGGTSKGGAGTIDELRTQLARIEQERLSRQETDARTIAGLSARIAQLEEHIDKEARR